MFDGPKAEPHVLLTGRFYSQVEWLDAEHRFAATFPYGDGSGGGGRGGSAGIARNRRMTNMVNSHGDIKQPVKAESGAGFVRVTDQTEDVAKETFRMMDHQEELDSESFSMQEVMELAVLHEKQMYGHRTRLFCFWICFIKWCC